MTNVQQLPSGASSVDQFCTDHNIGRGTFYNLRKLGLAPKIMKVGRRTLITKEAAAEWRSRMENQTSQVAA